MWDKFKTWHKETWNEGNVGKGKIIGGWFVVLAILSSANQNESSDAKATSSNKEVTDISKIEKLKQECEALSTKYTDSKLMLEKYLDKLNYKIGGKNFVITEPIQFINVWEDSGKYYADIHSNKGKINSNILLKNDEENILKIEKLAKSHKFINATLSGQASFAVCEIKDNKKSFFNTLKLVQKEILRDGYIVNGYKPIKLVSIDE